MRLPGSARPLRPVVAAALMAVATLARTAHAEGDDTARAEALYQQAERDDQDLHFADALVGYDAALAASSSFRFAPRARTRADVLRAHAEGGFAPLTELERVRRDPRLASDPASLAALAHDADAFPAGRVRVEARHLVAEAYLHRLERENDGVALLRLVIDDPSADALTQRQASRELVTTLLDRGDVDGAAEIASRPIADPSLAREVRVRVRRRRLHLASIVVLLSFVALAGASIVRSSRARRDAGRPLVARVGGFAKVALVFAAWVALAGGTLASTYESGSAKPFLGLGAATLPLLLLARAWSITGRRAPAATAFRSLLAAAAVLAAALLVLEAVDVSYLQDFGL